MHRTTRVLVLAAALAATACAPTAGADFAATPSRGSNVITREEILAKRAANAYELVRTLRPLWLHAQPHSARNPAADVILVYMNDTLLGTVDDLRQVTALEVGSLRFFGVAEANYRFGQGRLNGAIQVIPAAPSDAVGS